MHRQLTNQLRGMLGTSSEMDQHSYPQTHVYRTEGSNEIITNYYKQLFKNMLYPEVDQLRLFYLNFGSWSMTKIIVDWLAGLQMEGVL